MAQDITTKILEIVVQNDKAITSIAEYNSAIDRLREKQAELRKSKKEGKISEQEYQREMEISRQEMSRYRDAANTLSRQIANQVKAEEAEKGSLVQLRAELSNLTRQYDALSKTEREGATGTDLLDHINEVTTQIKQAEEATQRYYRNVGNYAGAFQGLREELRNLTAQLTVMKANGEDNSEEFNELVKRAGELKDAIADTQQQISNYASDTGSLDSLKQGITSITQAYAAFKIATDGLGFQNEALDKTFQVLSGSLTILNTLTTIQNSLQSQSALMKGVNAVKTWVLNAALGGQAAATTAVTAAETGATAATVSWTAALYANPIMWLVGIVIAVTGAIYGLIKAIDMFTSSNDEAKASLQGSISKLENMHEMHEKMTESAKDWGESEAAVHEMKIGFLEQEMEGYNSLFSQMSELYDEDDQEYKDYLEAKDKATNEFLDSWDDGNRALNKLICGYYQDELKEKMGNTEYKKKLINEEIDKWIELARTLEATYQGDPSVLRTEEKIADLEKLRQKRLAEADKEEEKSNRQRLTNAANANKKRLDEEKKRIEEEQKLQKALLEETRKAEEAMTNLIRDNVEKQKQLEEMSYSNKKQALEAKLALYVTESEYDIAMRKAINTQIEALTESHQRKLIDIEYKASQERLKLQEEILNKKLDVIRNSTTMELAERQKLLDIQYDIESEALDKRLETGEISTTQYYELLNYLTVKWQMDKTELDEQFAQQEVARQKVVFETQIALLTAQEDERLLKMKEGVALTEEEYQAEKERQLEMIAGHQADVLAREEEFAQKQYEALVARGRLTTQTQEEFDAELIQAKQNWLNKQKAINDAYIKNEEAKAQAMKAVTGSLTQLLDTLGESNKEFAIMSKIITLAQIAIDTGRALSAGIASASSVPFPGNIAAIATTVATIIANIATAISTVKSVKLAKGGKVTGEGSGTSDSIPAMLSNGEFVVNAEATSKYEPLLEAINNGNKVTYNEERTQRRIDAIESAMINVIETDRLERIEQENTRYEELVRSVNSAEDLNTLKIEHEQRLEEIERIFKITTLDRKYEEISERISVIESKVKDSESTYNGTINETMTSSTSSANAETNLSEVTNVISRSIIENVAKELFASVALEDSVRHAYNVVLDYDGGDYDVSRRTIALTLAADSMSMPQPYIAKMVEDIALDLIGTPKGFAAGGKVFGAGTSTSDSIPAMLSRGEFVMSAAATKLYEPLLVAMNNIGNGVPIQMSRTYEQTYVVEHMTEAFSTAAKEIKPVVSVVEITEAQDRVNMIENLDNF